MTDTLATFWFGAPLGIIEQISALSVIAAGHKLVIYTTDELKGVPPGIEIRPAREILDSEIVRHRKTGSAALHSDLFRYALLNKTDATWVDLDIVLLRPLPSDKPYLFGYESANEVNGAVLRLPKSSAALRELSLYNAETRGYPATLRGFRRFKYIVKSLGMGLHIADWPWGSVGPRALTHHLGKTGEIREALGINAFYPIAFEQAKRFATPDDLSLTSFPEETLAVHLWGKALRNHLRDKCGGRVPERSFLDLAALADMVDAAGPFKLHDEEEMLVAVAADIVPVAMDPVEIVRDMGELHAADIDPAGCTPHGLAPFREPRVEAAADGLQVIGPLIIGNRIPVRWHQTATVQ
ncbi:MAG: hypothetical protein RLZZ444_4670 [Pseudomonadota bacterium]